MTITVGDLERGDRTLFRLAKVDELDLLALVIERLQEAA